jgi:hypothetical protein
MHPEDLDLFATIAVIRAAAAVRGTELDERQMRLALEFPLDNHEGNVDRLLSTAPGYTAPLTPDERAQILTRARRQMDESVAAARDEHEEDGRAGWVDPSPGQVECALNDSLDDLVRTTLEQMEIDEEAFEATGNSEPRMP